MPAGGAAAHADAVGPCLVGSQLHAEHFHTTNAHKSGFLRRRLLIYHIIWFLMYGIGLWAFTAPQECPTGPTDPQEYVGTYVLLFIYTLWLVMAAVMLIISLRGEGSERL